MYKTEVGQLYHPNRRQWPQTPQLRFETAGAELALFLDSPTPAEISDVRTGKPRFGWVDSEHIGVLAFRFGTLPWWDAPFHPHPVAAAGLTPGMPAAGPGGHVLVLVTLVDASTGIIRALRQLTWPARFAGTVGASIDRMLAAPYNPQASEAAIEALYTRYDTTAKLVEARADITCTGGTSEVSDGAGPEAYPPPQATAGSAEPGSPGEVMAAAFGAYALPGRSYPGALPSELAPWYAYVADGGHSIGVLLAAQLDDDGPPVDRMVPAPVKAVLRVGWTVVDGFVVVDLPYDPQLGLVVQPGDDEF